MRRLPETVQGRELRLSDALLRSRCWPLGAAEVLQQHRRVSNLATPGRPRLGTTMPARSSLNVSLTQELTAFIAAQVASGRYRSASEVVRASLRLLQRDESAFATGSDPTDRVGGGDGGP